ncbi:hypothetical protein GDO86_009600 [Hymenochirus boettgeri]|uniref:Uncharacterized protein n=1 Tax=Hymenochirus boettgeri TaxID=247094 RepID=A0A8T2JPX6_9PIPI|nr:hypothetical protein GDO86_009600 [Hymenochirus boettgeri]
MPFPPISLHPHTFQSHRLQAANGGSRAALHSQSPGETRASTDTEELSNSWPSATFTRDMERTNRAQQAGGCAQGTRRVVGQVSRGITQSYESVTNTRNGTVTAAHRSRPCPAVSDPGRQQKIHSVPMQPPDGPFTLCLTPEAILVLQKRNLEKQMFHQQRPNARRIFASSGQGWGCRNREEPPHRSTGQRQHQQPPDVRELLKVSLLNEQHRYDDVEYEDDDYWIRRGDGIPGLPLDDALVRRCTEWLHGVEMATARDKNLHDKLQTLPHLNGY